MINVILSIGAFFLNWFLFWIVMVLIYSFFKQYLITRYLIAYPGVVVLYNILGWLTCLCIFLVYAIGSEFYYAFINYVPFHENTNRSQKYVDFLNSSLIVSSVIMTIFALVTVYHEEVEHQNDKKNNRTKA
jgi:hypothetical protein